MTSRDELMDRAGDLVQQPFVARRMLWSALQMLDLRQLAQIVDEGNETADGIEGISPVTQALVWERFNRHNPRK